MSVAWRLPPGIEGVLCPGTRFAHVDVITFECGRTAASTRVTVDQRELVERAGRGDHDAFAVLVDASITRLEAAARLILRDPELARDAVQEAYIRAWRELPRLRDPEKFDAWLHRLTVNACLDAVRRRRRRPIEVEISPIMPPTIADLSGHVADRDELERGFRRIGARPPRGARPALLRRPLRLGGGRDPRHPRGHRAIAPAPSSGRAPRRRGGRRAPAGGTRTAIA